MSVRRGRVPAGRLDRADYRSGYRPFGFATGGRYDGIDHSLGLADAARSAIPRVGEVHLLPMIPGLDADLADEPSIHPNEDSELNAKQTQVVSCPAADHVVIDRHHISRSRHVGQPGPSPTDRKSMGGAKPNQV